MSTIHELIKPIIKNLSDLREKSKVSHESCCACVALKLQSNGFEAHPLRVQVKTDDDSFDHCVVLVKNDGSLQLRPFEGTDYVLVELISSNELREMYSTEGITYNCENVKDSIFNPLPHFASLPQITALLITHALL